VESGVNGVAVNFDGSAPETTPAKMVCPASKHNVARATAILLNCDPPRESDVGNREAEI
jgi:hypothetical protein